MKTVKEDIARPVEILRGYAGIAIALCTSVERIKDIESMGAPIFKDRGRPKAEKAELWQWYRAYVQKEDLAAYDL